MQVPFASVTCDNMSTARWAHTMVVRYPDSLMFRVYGFNCSVSAGTGNLQIMNLIINVFAGLPTNVANISNDLRVDVYPNPANGLSEINYVLTRQALVGMHIYNSVGREVVTVEDQYRETGAHSLTVDPTVPGLYFVKLRIDRQVIVRRFVKL